VSADRTIRYVPYATNRLAARGPDDPVARAAGRSAFGSRIAVEDGAVEISFEALGAAALRATRAFLAAGVWPGECVALWAPNMHEWIVAALGLQGAGGVLVPINTRWKGSEAGYVLRKCRARLLLTVGEFLGTRYPALLADEDLPALERIVCLRGEAAGTLAWQAFLAQGDAVGEADARGRADAVSPDALSDLLFTSGTTGKPKGVMTTHAQNLRAFAAWSEVVGLREGDRLAVNPFFHSFGQGGLAVFAVARRHAAPAARLRRAGGARARGADRISRLPGPPTLYQSIRAPGSRAKYDLSTLRLAVTGAAAIPVELIHRMRRELGFETIITGYGLTECCGIVSMCRYDDDPETIATTSGRAIPDTEVRCVDREGKPVPSGQPGEVVVRGYVMRGY
jgi:acyl-CoA synthetase (AMP-forming)/AMP-acid ligase II